jgi:hypothetical protein
MRQMKIDGLGQVFIDYESPGLAKSVQDLRPALYKEGNLFCCVLGPSPQEGIFGCGESVDTALAAWDKQLKNRLIDPKEDDEVIQFVLDNIDASSWIIW